MDAFRVTDQLVNSAVPAVADIATVEVSDATLHEHVALVHACDGIGFRRAAFRDACHRGCARAYRIGETCPIPCGTPYRRSLRDMRPRVVPHIPAQARWLARDSIRAEVMRQNGVHSLMVVPLVANHVPLGLVAFYRCQGSSPFRQADLRATTNLVKQTALALDAIRRDLQEQAMGRRFQRALLGQPPHLTAIKEVDGHVPVDGPPGGWFDVIPLPSARVGLVAGVCGGHGITAAAAMSQQKAQVRALAVQGSRPGIEPRFPTTRTPVRILGMRGRPAPGSWALRVRRLRPGDRPLHCSPHRPGPSDRDRRRRCEIRCSLHSGPHPCRPLRCR
ncbi:GAF domain-containing protein [Streptomyces sp. NPDC059489]|uniref:GAF domain-containing protein n=1 Tax=Streptomyces sp. NPDC059489 TaxID=3346849 RepID=UPI003674C06C